MTCQHDATYRIDNEANGGQGCPLCNADRGAARVVSTLERYARNEQRTAPAERFQSQAVTLELSAAQIADMEARTAETMTEAPDYPGMWM